MLSKYIRLIVFVFVILRLVIFCLRLCLVFISNEEFVEYFEQFLYLIHTLKHLLLLSRRTSSSITLSLFLAIFVQKVFLQLAIAIFACITLRHNDTTAITRVILRIICARSSSTFGCCSRGPIDLLLSFLEYLMRLDLIQHDLSIISPGGPLNFLSQGCELIYGICDFLSESQYQGPN
jgi:hypothetical protein